MQTPATLTTFLNGAKSTFMRLEQPSSNAGLWYVPMARFKAAIRRLGDPTGVLFTSTSSFRVIDTNGRVSQVIYAESYKYPVFLYWVSRRQHTASKIRWVLGAPQAIDDAGYCLDRPSTLFELGV